MDNLERIFKNLENAGVPTRNIKAVKFHLKNRLSKVVPIIYAEDFIVNFNKEQGKLFFKTRYNESVTDEPLALEVQDYFPLLEEVLVKEAASC